MQQIQPKFTVTQDGVTLNIYHANKGEGLPRHEHVYSHLTMCFSMSSISKSFINLEIKLLLTINLDILLFKIKHYNLFKTSFAISVT